MTSLMSQQARWWMYLASIALRDAESKPERRRRKLLAKEAKHQRRVKEVIASCSK